MNRKRPPSRNSQDRYSYDYRDRGRSDSGRGDSGRGRSDRAGSRFDTDNSRSSGGGIKSALNYTTLAVIAGVFILGIGVGIGFSSSASVDPQNVASREFIDRSAPNPELCLQYGASAIAMDTRLFVTFSPFSVYLSQPTMKPGCVMRSNNWNVLKQQGVVTNEQVNDCKNRMNTFAYTGSVESNPRIDCVYQNDAAGNLFLNQPGVVPAQESERF
ncbi:MAG: DUF3172 domain-containing protein [Cyanophyceae cyanobacterium]